MPRQLPVGRTSCRRVDAKHSTDARSSKSSKNVLRLHPKVRFLSLRDSQIGAFFPAWVVIKHNKTTEKRVSGFQGISVNHVKAASKNAVLKASGWSLNHTKRCDEIRSAPVFADRTISEFTLLRLVTKVICLAEVFDD